jgi:hypothetical protein
MSSRRGSWPDGFLLRYRPAFTTLGRRRWILVGIGSAVDDTPGKAGSGAPRLPRCSVMGRLLSPGARPRTCPGGAARGRLLDAEIVIAAHPQERPGGSSSRTCANLRRGPRPSMGRPRDGSPSPACRCRRERAGDRRTGRPGERDGRATCLAGAHDDGSETAASNGDSRPTWCALDLGAPPLAKKGKRSPSTARELRHCRVAVRLASRAASAASAWGALTGERLVPVSRHGWPERVTAGRSGFAHMARDSSTKTAPISAKRVANSTTKGRDS